MDASWHGHGTRRRIRVASSGAGHYTVCGIVSAGTDSDKWEIIYHV